MLTAVDLLEKIKKNLENFNAAVTVNNQEITFKKFISSKIENEEIVLFDEVIASSNTTYYAEGFQMLSQSMGTFSNITEIGRCPDDKEPYKKSKFITNEYKEGYNYILLNEGREKLLIGALSCNKYQLKFRIYNSGRLTVVMQIFSHANKLADTIESEIVTVLGATSNNELLKSFSARINRYNKRLFAQKPSGWCSWYCYYENISEQIIKDNLRLMKHIDNTKYVLIDDGYQKHMGDWLDFTNKFSNNLQDLIKEIKDAGKEPGIWVAPFIASGDSELFRKNKEYFAKSRLGKLEDAGVNTYEGWRDLPWYSLDFSIEEVRNYISRVFSYFHDVLNIRFYKLDACYWGACEHLVFKSGITPIENYRLGLKTILDVVGKDSILLGCNAPFWPSIGLVHSMRISDDVIRNKDRFIQQLNELRHRTWMNESLWINDPDCMCLHNYKNQIADPEDFMMHVATILLANGSVFLGDSLDKISPNNKKLIKRILDIHKDCIDINISDEFDSFILQGNKYKTRIFFNLDSQRKTFSLKEEFKDFFTGKMVKGDLTLDYGKVMVVSNI